MNINEIELLVKEAKKTVDTLATNWASRLQEHINFFSKNGTANLESEDDLTLLFDSDNVCSTGQASSTPIKDTLANVEFRKWFSDQVKNLRAQEEKETLTIDEIIHFYDAATNWFKKLSKNKTTKIPWLKLTRALCALFPNYFTTIGNIRDLKILYKAMFEGDAHHVEMHVKVKNKIKDVLYDLPAENSINFIKYLILPWYMAETIKVANSPLQQISQSRNIGGNMNKNLALNQILYGPPGTGKTFNTINKALSIADPEFQIEIKSRAEIKKRFDQLVDQGQIVFTTFHQSMSYEDFIEGIKPETNENGTVTYDVKSGIFKEICNSASAPNKQGFEAAYKEFQKLLNNYAEGKLFELLTPNKKKFSVTLNSKGNLSLYTGDGKNRQGVLTKENLQKQINGEEIWYGGYHKGVISYLKEKFGYSLENTNSDKNYVLIIDEINRGNVSQIFGELITLIEDGKRIGQKEALTIKLPYSRESERDFGVPSNVYIIGTMNTADRSVEALDAALRRRFDFIEMLPNPELIRTEGALKDQNGKLEVDGPYSIDLADLLKTINHRIEKLLDSDHQIGHSFFLSVDSISLLKRAFQNKIIPLLKEYFYGDFGKLGLVLGEGFFESIETSNNLKFANFGEHDDSDFNERVVYKIKKIYSHDDESMMSDKDFIEAINKLLNK